MATFDLRVPFGDDTISSLPADLERSVLRYQVSVDLATDATGGAATGDIFQLLHIPAGMDVLSLAATINTAATGEGSTTTEVADVITFKVGWTESDTGFITTADAMATAATTTMGSVPKHFGAATDLIMTMIGVYDDESPSDFDCVATAGVIDLEIVVAPLKGTVSSDKYTADTGYTPVYRAG